MKANKHKPLTFDRAIKRLALGWHIVRFMNGSLFNGTNYYMTPNCANPNNVATLYPLDKLVFYRLLDGNYTQAGLGSCAFRNCYIGTPKAVQLYLIEKAHHPEDKHGVKKDQRRKVKSLK